MEHITIVGGEGYPDVSKFPKEDDYWNANVSNIKELNNVKIASCVCPLLGVSNIYSIIILESGTTQSDILDDWQGILEFREKLKGNYGKLKNPLFSYHQSVYRLHNDFNLSYGEIAKYLNFQILIYLCIDFGLVQLPGMEEPNIFRIFFYQFLMAFGYKTDDADAYYKEVKKDLNNGKFPWKLSKGPIAADTIRDRIKYFNKKVNEENLIIDRTIERLFDPFILMGSWEFLMELYERTYKVTIKEKQLFDKWYDLRNLIISDMLLHMKEFYPTPPGWEK